MFEQNSVVAGKVLNGRRLSINSKAVPMGIQLLFHDKARLKDYRKGIETARKISRNDCQNLWSVHALKQRIRNACLLKAFFA